MRCFLFTLLSLFAFQTTYLQAQLPAVFDAVPLPKQDLPAVNKHLSAYRLYKIPTKEITAFLRSKQGSTGTFTLRLGSEYAWTLHLVAHDVRSPQFSLVEITNKGSQTLPTPPVYTYKGTLAGGGEVRLFIDEGFVMGFVTTASGEEIWIEPLNYRLAAAPDDVFVVYNSGNAINTHPFTCHSTPDLLPQTHAHAAQPRQLNACTEVEVAFVADYLLYQEKETTDRVQKQLTAVLNAVQPSYDQFNVELVITQIIISTCETCDGFSNTLDPVALQTSFRQWGNAGGITAGFDIAQLWTNRDFTGSVVGISPVGTLCTDNRYSLVQDYSPNFNALRAVSAHEMGHCFGATHDPANSLFLMQPTIVPSLTQFSANSVSQIAGHLSARTCFTQNCPFCLAATDITYDAAIATLTWEQTAPTCSLKLKRQGFTTFILQTVVSGSSYTFSGLSACYNYEVELQPICESDITAYPQTFVINASAIPTAVSVSQSAPGAATINWLGGGGLVNLRIKEAGSSVNLVNTLLTNNSYTINGLNACRSYTVELQSVCVGFAMGNVVTTAINAVQPLVAYATMTSATTANVGFITYTFPDFAYLLRLKQQGSSTWLFETPAQTGVNYPVTGLQPCTNYELYAYANCGAELGVPRVFQFKTANLFISGATPQNCQPATATYDLALTVIHQQLSGQFTVNVAGNSYPQSYTTSPQQVIITGLPATGAASVPVTVADAANPSLCSGSFSFAAPRPQCSCSVVYAEQFDACLTPPGWTNTAIGFNATALWQFGKAPADNSINGTCMAYFDDDAFDTDGGESVMLESPAFNLSNYQAATLRFDYNFNTIAGFFRVRIWNGATWIDGLQIYSGNCGFWGCTYPKAEIDLTPHLNANLRVRFIYNDGGGWDWYAGIDNVEICGFSGLSVCNAGFNYPAGNSYCKAQGIVYPMITGNPGGTFAATPAGLVIDAQTGAVNLPESASGSYTITYTSGSFGSCTQSVIFTVLPNCSVKLFAKVMLQGAYNATTTQMNTTLLMQGLLPITQPYNTAPWNYAGTEAYASYTQLPSNMVDWVLIELRHATTRALLQQKAVLLLADGWLIEVNGSSSAGIEFSGIAPNTPVFVAIRHRNHLPILSAAPVTLPNNGNTYDFTLTASRAMYNLQAELGSKAGLYLGDIDANGVINFADINRYRLQLLQLNAYRTADVNMDGSVTVPDFNTLLPNVRLFSNTELRY